MSAWGRSLRPEYSVDPMSQPVKDLIVLVADKQLMQTLLGLFGRTISLGIRPIDFDIRVHPHRDSGCRVEGAEFLRSFQNQYAHALLMFDHDGSGREKIAPADLERQLDEKLSTFGWGDRAKTIVIQPELEIWVWSPSRAVDRILGWDGRLPELRDWLVRHRWTSTPGTKPEKPKEALEAALAEVKKVASGALYHQLAKTVGFQDCQDRAFLRLLDSLRTWFPATATEGEIQ